MYDTFIQCNLNDDHFYDVVYCERGSGIKTRSDCISYFYWSSLAHSFHYPRMVNYWKEKIYHFSVCVSCIFFPFHFFFSKTPKTKLTIRERTSSFYCDFNFGFCLKINPQLSSSIFSSFRFKSLINICLEFFSKIKIRNQ